MSPLKGTRITWLGHATFLVQTPRGTTLLVDPFISGNPKYPKDFVLPDKIDYILLTHGHGDHIGDAVAVATKYSSTVVAIYELAAFIGSKGVRSTLGMNLGGTVEVADVAITMVDAKHSAGAQDEHGTHYVGVAAGFVLTISSGPVMYCAGDTNVFGDMKLISDLYHPDVALLPIGGFYTMGPKEAALAAHLVGAATILPIHFGTFPPLKGTPSELATLLGSEFNVIHWVPGQTL